MYYYEVFVAEQRYQKQEPLTYASDALLSRGTVVRVPYGKRTVGGFVSAQVSKPSFKTKLIEEIVSDVVIPEMIFELHSWILDFYPAGSGSITQLFIPSDVKPAKLKDIQRPSNRIEPPKLTDEQKEVLQHIQTSPKKHFLLHGETGSGKTRVYVERVLSAIQNKKSAIVLTPEISLVPQLVQVFSALTDRPIVEFHSGLTKAQKNKNWLTLLQSTTPVIVIGTRSAVFAPLPNLGIIVIDEMHEPAYKQDSAPHYSALRVAAKRAQLEQAEIIYGSATPPVTEYFMASQGNVPIVRLTETAMRSVKPAQQVIDIKDASQFTRHRYLSNQLLDAVEKNIKNHEQSLLFLNRRGTARQILCQTCGWQALCPKCDLPLTLHADTHEVRCHTCGYHSKPPFACLSCQGSDIVYRSLGTKALADYLQRLFPESRIRRFDTDNTASETLGRNFDEVHSGNVDILIGTQMLGKGLDLPNLSLVGIVNADTALHMPDYSSLERGYQLLHQALGRVGRGHRAGKVIIQTFQPDDRLIIAAMHQNWSVLYEYEISERKQYLFPPFCYLLKITVSRRTSHSAEVYIQNLANEVRRSATKVQIEAPSPSFHERSHGKYNWQFVIKARDRTQLTNIIRNLPSGDYSYDLDPLNLL